MPRRKCEPGALKIKDLTPQSSKAASSHSATRSSLDSYQHDPVDTNAVKKRIHVSAASSSSSQQDWPTAPADPTTSSSSQAVPPTDEQWTQPMLSKLVSLMKGMRGERARASNTDPFDAPEISSIRDELIKQFADEGEPGSARMMGFFDSSNKIKDQFKRLYEDFNSYRYLTEVCGATFDKVEGQFNYRDRDDYNRRLKITVPDDDDDEYSRNIRTRLMNSPEHCFWFDDYWLFQIPPVQTNDGYEKSIPLTEQSRTYRLAECSAATERQEQRRLAAKELEESVDASVSTQRYTATTTLFKMLNNHDIDKARFKRLTKILDSPYECGILANIIGSSTAPYDEKLGIVLVDSNLEIIEQGIEEYALGA